jgi:hypothetical protein
MRLRKALLVLMLLQQGLEQVLVLVLVQEQVLEQRQQVLERQKQR